MMIGTDVLGSRRVGIRYCIWTSINQSIIFITFCEVVRSSTDIYVLDQLKYNLHWILKSETYDELESYSIRL